MYGAKNVNTLPDFKNKLDRLFPLGGTLLPPDYTISLLFLRSCWAIVGTHVPLLSCLVSWPRTRIENVETLLLFEELVFRVAMT